MKHNLAPSLIFIAPILIVALAACEKQTTLEKNEERKEVTSAEADNTKKNRRDVDPERETKTPMDQGESEADRTITADIRKDVVADDSLSINAKNVKIITSDGIVTLRGAVANEREKTTIDAVAKKTAGVKRIENQLELSQ